MSPNSRRSNRRSNSTETYQAGHVKKQKVVKTTSNQIEKESTDIPLYMECSDEPLSAAQEANHKKKWIDYSDQLSNLESLLYQYSKVLNEDGASISGLTSALLDKSKKDLVNQNNSQKSTAQSNYRQLMDQKAGKIIGSMNKEAAQTQLRTNRSMPRLAGQKSENVIKQQNTQRATIQRIPSKNAIKPAVVPNTGSNSMSIGRNAASSTSSPANIYPPSSQPNTLFKDFPSLAVVAKTYKDPPSNASSLRSELDGKVKALIVNTPAKFTEWLIQQGLLLAEQYDFIPGKGKIKLKLGKHGDGKKFPNSGGYVWLNEANKMKFVSVYRGSIFETIIGNCTPIVILKLIYHWACQTTINNVIQWVKVDISTINHYWQLMRSITIVTVQEDFTNFGKGGKLVEVGVISLGTTTSDGSKREVRVEVLGVLDHNTNKIRLRATEPTKMASQAEKFAKIFEPLPIWIDKTAQIVTDYSVDKDRLLKLGFANLTQCNLQSKRPEMTNAKIMEYLKRIVPKMFQNNLSLLPTNTIQQFLDELTFREYFGHYPLLCFDNIMKQIATQTAATIPKNTTLLSMLKGVIDNPLNDCRIIRSIPNRSSMNRAVDVQQNKPTALKSSNNVKRKKDDEHETEVKPVKKIKTGNPTHNTFTAQDLDNLAIYDIDREDCSECKRKLSLAGHFSAYLCCDKCRYSTCCSKAMTTHVNIFHNIKTAQDYNLGTAVVLKDAMFCVCGFSSTSGMKLAKHLITNGCRSVYPNEESAKDAQKPCKKKLTKEEIKNIDTESDLIKDEVKKEKTKTEEEVQKEQKEMNNSEQCDPEGMVEKHVAENKNDNKEEEAQKEQENMDNSEQCEPESKVEKHIAESENDNEGANENIDCGTRKSTDDNANDSDNTET